MLRRQEELKHQLLTIDADMKLIEGQTIDNKGEIQKVKQQEIIDVPKELDEIRNWVTQIIHYNTNDDSELLNFSECKRNCIEFLNGFKKIVNSNKENGDIVCQMNALSK